MRPDLAPIALQLFAHHHGIGSPHALAELGLGDADRHRIVGRDDDPKQHRLEQSLDADIRAQTGTQDFVGTAPLNLVYVAHGERMQDIAAEERRLYASVDAGFIGQNVYLFCASEGLATVFRGAVDYQRLAITMKLGAEQFVTFAQTVGYPKI